MFNTMNRIRNAPVAFGCFCGSFAFAFFSQQIGATYFVLELERALLIVLFYVAILSLKTWKDLDSTIHSVYHWLILTFAIVEGVIAFLILFSGGFWYARGIGVLMSKTTGPLGSTVILLGVCRLLASALASISYYFSIAVQ